MRKVLEVLHQILMIVIKAIIIVVALIALMYAVFIGAMIVMSSYGNVAGIFWLFGWLVAMFSFGIAMSQEENWFNRNVTKLGKAFWYW